MNVCICFGPDWLKHIPIELESMFLNNKVENLYLMSEKLSEANLTVVRNLCDEYEVNVTYIDMLPFEQTHLTSKKNIDTRFTKYTLYRLAVPDFVPHDRVLYLDADTLVTGDINEFYNIDLGDNFIAGCLDTGITDEHKIGIGGPVGQPYINAGVILMDLKKLREENMTRKWISMMNKTHYPAHDQDIIFLTCAGRIKLVGPEYNCSVSTSIDIPNDQVKIVHYAGDKRLNWVYPLPKAELWSEAENVYLSKRLPVVDKQPRINKLIAYCWFGHAQKPQKIQECIDSWKKFCPDWKIIELNEDNCDVNTNPFVAMAYKAKKYAFVADYFRLEAMYCWGCVTLDADVELLKPLDCFLYHRFFSGQEIDDQVLITAVMGAERNHPVVRDLMSFYETAKWTRNYNVPNTTWITKKFKTLIKKKEIDGSLVLEHGTHLYPKYYFCNYDHKRLQIIPDVRSYAIHWFRGSWR